MLVLSTFVCQTVRPFFIDRDVAFQRTVCFVYPIPALGETCLVSWQKGQSRCDRLAVFWELFVCLILCFCFFGFREGGFIRHSSYFIVFSLDFQWSSWFSLWFFGISMGFSWGFLG